MQPGSFMASARGANIAGGLQEELKEGLKQRPRTDIAKGGDHEKEDMQVERARNNNDVSVLRNTSSVDLNKLFKKLGSLIFIWRVTRTPGSKVWVPIKPWRKS